MSSKKKRIPRRKSQILDSRTQVTSSDHTNCGENDYLNQLYRNKDYRPPEIKQFETIYEPSSKVRRGLIEEDGTLKVGRGLGHRFIDFASIEYWRCDNKERNKKRKAMVTKQFKGRKRNKGEPLSDKAYDELFEMIANKEDSITESDSEQDNGETAPFRDSLNKLPVQLKMANGGSTKIDLSHEDENVEHPQKCSDTTRGSVQPFGTPSETSLSSLTVKTDRTSPASRHLSCQEETLPSCEARNLSHFTIEIVPEDKNKMCLPVQGSNCVRRSARIKSKSEDIELEVQGRKNGQADRSRSANELDVLGSILVAGENPSKRRRFRKDFLSVGDCEVFESQDNSEKTVDSNDTTNAKAGSMDRIDEHLELEEAVDSEECRNSDQDFTDKELLCMPGENKRRSSTYKDLSGLGVSFGHAGDDISMPAVVRRSLSGEIVLRRSGEFGFYRDDH